MEIGEDCDAGSCSCRVESLQCFPPPDPNYPRTSDALPQATSPKQPEMTYSGERKLVGIATMHKSNQVPVFADKDDTSGRKKATEITRMKGNK